MKDHVSQSFVVDIFFNSLNLSAFLKDSAR